MLLFRSLLVVLGLSASTSVLAHNGEHAMGVTEGLMHFFFSPFHLAIVIAIIMMILLLKIRGSGPRDKSR